MSLGVQTPSIDNSDELHERWMNPDSPQPSSIDWEFRWQFTRLAQVESILLRRDTEIMVEYAAFDQRSQDTADPLTQKAEPDFYLG